MANACATCASRYDSALDPASEKPLLPGRQLECCSRSICYRCLNQNQRYKTYCPYCQLTTEPSPLPQGLKDPPPYSSQLNDHSPPDLHRGREPEDDDDQPPAYSSHSHPTSLPPEKSPDDQPAPDVLHFLTPTDTMLSLSLAYSVPIAALRKTNTIYADHLLPGRKTVLIPGEHYKGGISLSPQPMEGEEEETKKNKTRRWMVACKVSEYDVALLYLRQANWDLQAAMDAYREDERWEKEHPLAARQRGVTGKSPVEVGMRRFVGHGSRTGAQ